MTDEALIPVPSGQPISFLEVVTDRPGQGLVYRFRFVAPEIAREKGQADFEMIGRDMEFLCATYALPRIASVGPVPNQVIISLSDRPTVFAEADTEATQFFEAYSIDGDACIWEPF
jgi:hypothetical protein